MKIFKLLKSSNKTSEWDYESAGKKKTMTVSTVIE